MTTSLILAYWGTELANVDRVARDAYPEALFAELVELAIVRAGAFVSEGHAAATDACLAARTAELVVIATKLRGVLALGDAGPFEADLGAVATDPVAAHVAAAVADAIAALANRAGSAALGRSAEHACRHLATDRHAQTVVGALLSERASAEEVDPAVGEGPTASSGPEAPSGIGRPVRTGDQAHASEGYPG
jgi:hypothetical protein